MAFVTLRRPSTLDRDVERAVEVCPAASASLESEIFHAVNPGGWPAVLVSDLCSIVAACLLYSKGLRTQRFGNGTLWPTSARDLLPYGAKASLAGLLHWFDTEESAEIVNGLTGVLSICRRELMPELIDDERTRTAFVASVCRHLDTAAAAHRRLRRPADWDKRHDRRPAYRISSICLLLQLIATGPGSDTASWARFARGFEGALLASFDGARRALGPCASHELLALFAVSTHEALGTPPERMPAPLREYALRFRAMEDDPYQRLFNQLLNVSRTVGCCAPGCATHPHDIGEGGKMQRCSGCRLLQYCSRECQKRHWKQERWPHKAVCARLKALPDWAIAQGGMDGYDKWMLACEDTTEPDDAAQLALDIGPYVPVRLTDRRRRRESSSLVQLR